VFPRLSWLATFLAFAIPAGCRDHGPSLLGRAGTNQPRSCCRIAPLASRAERKETRARRYSRFETYCQCSRKTARSTRSVRVVRATARTDCKIPPASRPGAWFFLQRSWCGGPCRPAPRGNDTVGQSAPARCPFPPSARTSPGPGPWSDVGAQHLSSRPSWPRFLSMARTVAGKLSWVGVKRSMPPALASSPLQFHLVAGFSWFCRPPGTCGRVSAPVPPSPSISRPSFQVHAPFRPEAFPSVPPLSVLSLSGNVPSFPRRLRTRGPGSEPSYCS